MWDKLSMFGFQALWSPSFLLFCLMVVGVYGYLNRVYGKAYPVEEGATLKHYILFITGMVLVYLSVGGPVDVLGHILFTVHMLQMTCLYLIAVPLLILGVPVWMHRIIIETSVGEGIFNTMGKPLIALFLFNGVFSIYHFPKVFDLVKTNVFLHPVFLSVIFCCAYLMWWPVLNPIKDKQTLSPLYKIAYMFANGMLLSPACALIIFSQNPMYATYSDPVMWAKAMQLCVPPNIFSGLHLTGPEFFADIPVVRDQQTGGIVMKILQEVVYGTVIGYVFFGWVRSEKEKEKLNPFIPEYVRMQQMKNQGGK